MRRSTINRLLDTALVLVGLGLWGLTGLVTYRAWPTFKQVVTQPPPSVAVKQSCAEAANALGFIVQQSGRDVHASLPQSEIAHLKSAFSDASVLIPMCAGYRLQSFCAGRGCGPNAVFLSLVPVVGA